MRWLFLGLSLLSALLSSAPAAAADCRVFEQRAGEIRDMRDTDPQAGVRNGEAALLEIDQIVGGCRDAGALILGAIGSNLHILGRNQEALTRFEMALDLASPDADPEILATLHRGAGVVLAELEVHDQALLHYLASLRTSEAMGDVLESAKTASNIGNLYNTLGELDESRRYHRRALESFETAEWPLGIAGTSINLGALAGKVAAQAEAQGDSERARVANEQMRDHNLRALAIFEQIDNPRGIAHAANNIGTALDRLGQSMPAMDYHLTALRLRQDIGDRHGVMMSLLSLIDSHLALGDPDQAAHWADEAAAVLPSEIQLLALELAVRQVRIEEARGDYRAALDAQRRVTRLRMEVSEEEAWSRVEKVRASFNAEQREQLIELLQSQATVAELRSQRQRWILLGSLTFTLLLMVMFGMLYSRYRAKSRTAAENSRAARRDPLTGLANRREMREQIDRGIRQWYVTGQAFTLIMADIDDFKPINDRHGHEAGDQALVHLARILVDNVRGRDVVGRWGGEEFLLYLPDTRLESAESVAANLKSAIAASPVTLGDQLITLGVTFGVTEFQPGQSLDECIRRADQAMYQGKSRGKNQVATLPRSIS